MLNELAFIEASGFSGKGEAQQSRRQAVLGGRGGGSSPSSPSSGSSAMTRVRDGDLVRNAVALMRLVEPEPASAAALGQTEGARWYVSLDPGRLVAGFLLLLPSRLLFDGGCQLRQLRGALCSTRAPRSAYLGQCTMRRLTHLREALRWGSCGTCGSGSVSAIYAHNTDKHTSWALTCPV